MRQSIFFCLAPNIKTIIMNLTAEYILARFQFFNKTIFAGKLPPLPIRVGNARRSLGLLTYSRKGNALLGRKNSNFRMTISAYYDLTEVETDDVIIHEMIHYYIAYNNIKDTGAHGRVFRDFMDRINRKYGTHVCISGKVKHTDIVACSAPMKWRFVCITELHDGRTGVTVAARTRVFQLWKLLPSVFRIRSCKWYASCNPYFAKYPVSIKPKIYVVQRDELLAHLTGAKELHNDGKTIKPRQE
mgnify:FL=1